MSDIGSSYKSHENSDLRPRPPVWREKQGSLWLGVFCPVIKTGPESAGPSCSDASCGFQSAFMLLTHRILPEPCTGGRKFEQLLSSSQTAGGCIALDFGASERRLRVVMTSVPGHLALQPQKRSLPFVHQHSRRFLFQFKRYALPRRVNTCCPRLAREVNVCQFRFLPPPTPERHPLGVGASYGLAFAD